MTAPPRKRRVLFVEDEAPLRAAYARLFGGRYELAFAATGMEALREFERFAPEVVVLDLRLPDVDGIDVLAKIRATNTAVRVVVTSSYASMEPQIGMLGLGLDAYLQKPFDSGDLARLIDGGPDR
jgi:two-component system response regulator AtoC